MPQPPDPSRLPVAYWRLAGAAGINAVGQGVFAAAVPLLAATITRDPRLVSVVSAAAYLPWLLLSLPAGALVDRYDRAGLMWRSQATQALIVGSVAVLAAFDRIDIATLAMLTFGLGMCQVVVGNAAQAILPDLVGKHLLHAANGYQQTIIVVGQQFVGPAVGGLLFAVAVAFPFGLDAAALVLSAVLLATLPRAEARKIVHPPLRTAMAEGLRWLARHRLLRTLAFLLGVNTFCFHLAHATLVLLATQTLHINPSGYGLLLAGAAVGSLAGGLVGPRVVAMLGSRDALFVALGTNVVAFAGIGVSPNATVLGGLLAVSGFATILWNIITVSLRQQIVPSDMLGRVSSIYRMVGWGLIPLGALTGGLVAHQLGLRAPFPIAGGIRAIALLIGAPVLIRAMRS
ncbi:MFS transporter [Phytoactinopolyspora endophytica]|uniref:MFS transporter n=1 Tax=Phytoactinopolyspora endophytica TaxID=1642495 RepID=UPI00101D1686|nr:MFS transporter [Phytoactinopolyspora endophytica]